MNSVLVKNKKKQILSFSKWLMTAFQECELFYCLGFTAPFQVNNKTPSDRRTLNKEKIHRVYYF